MATFYDEMPETPEGAEPATDNLASAALFVCEVLAKHQIRCALLGGFACMVLGNGRQTGDVDICIQSSFRQLRAIHEPEARLHLPRSRLVSGVLRVFIRTGQPWDICPDEELVPVDLKEAGEGAGPRTLDEGAIVHVKWGVTDMPNATFPVLNISHLLRAKLWAWNRRCDQKFDRDDIMWLLETYSDMLDKDVLDKDIAVDFANALEDAKEREWVLDKIGASHDASLESD